MDDSDAWSFDLRPCPHCGTNITKTARTCRSCGGEVQPLWKEDQGDLADRMLLPVGRPASAIAAGYLGLFSVLPFFGVLSIIVSLFAMRTLRRKPELIGWGRAYFGLVMGTVMTLLYLVPFGIILLKS